MTSAEQAARQRGVMYLPLKKPRCYCLVVDGAEVFVDEEHGGSDNRPAAETGGMEENLF